jgi:ABC-type branched-subunit amino acid transport system substrate-binding protein
VRWYGSDGAARELSVITDLTAATFAWATGFQAMLYDEFFDGPQTFVVAQAIRDQTNMAPEAYAMTAYDSTVIAGLAVARAGGTSSMSRFSSAFLEVANDYFGATGPVDLNANGDRTIGGYGVWAVVPIGGELVWLQVADYDFEAGTLSAFERTRPVPRPSTTASLPPLGAPGTR